MPASSIDTFLACSIMVILVLSAMAATTKLMNPYLSGLAHRNDDERFQTLGSYFLASKGTPSNWGQSEEIIPTDPGLAKSNATLPYELDVDKVTRLNSENVYSLTYAQLLQSLGATDVAFRIEIKTLFDVSINQLSSLIGNNETSYEFSIVTKKSGMPVPSDLRCYVIIRDFVDNVTSSTFSNGQSSIWVSIPNSLNGNALLLVFAKAKLNSQIVGFNLFTFEQNAVTNQPKMTFTKLSPLNYVLNVSFNYAHEEVLTAQAFTYNYHFNLTEMTEGNRTAEYAIPRLQDSSPIIAVITGLNGTFSFAEGVSYPEVPLQIGEDFSQSNAGAEILSYSYVVTLNSVLYELVITCGGPS